MSKRPRPRVRASAAIRGYEMPLPSRVLTFGAVLDRCQVIVLQPVAVGHATIYAEVRDLVEKIPSSLNAPEWLVLQRVLTRVLGRVCSEAAIADDPDVVSAVGRMAICSDAPEVWRAE